MIELKLTSYVVLVWLLFISFCLAPTEALALDTTQYARVVAQAERIAYLAAQRSSFAAKVAAAAVAPSPASMAVRLVAGPVGWAALGVSAGLVIASLYYSASDLQSVKQSASGGASSYSIPGYTLFPIVAGGNCPSPIGGCTNKWARIHTNNYCDLNLYTPSPVPAGWIFGGWETCGERSNMLVVGGTNLQTTPVEPTAQQVQQYVQALPPSNPQSIESHSAPVGEGQTAPSADTVESQPVSPTELPTTVNQNRWRQGMRLSPTTSHLQPGARSKPPRSSRPRRRLRPHRILMARPRNRKRRRRRLPVPSGPIKAARLRRCCTSIKRCGRVVDS
jgi:hypothetical protein